MKIIDDNLMNGLAEEAKKSPRLRKNYNFHQSLQDKCHRFLNALEPGTFIPVHHHPDKDETFSSPLAVEYGFSDKDSGNDPARRFRSTLYAKCRGAWWSSVEGYRGNSFWFMRTSGYTSSSITNVCDFGYLYNQGTAVTCDDAAVLPAITVDLEKASLQKTTSVESTDVNN